MKVAIMQPYFFPYIGYFQLITTVDMFIVYDNIKYTKKGWINRNRILQNGKNETFSLPLSKGSDSLNICEREVAPNFNREKLLNRIRGAYMPAPFFAQTFQLVEEVVRFQDTNLFRFLFHSILKTCGYLNIGTEILKSSSFDVSQALKSQEKVLALCSAASADTYVNASGGKHLYSKGLFLEKGIELKFIHSKPFEYSQFGDTFVPWLSIIDVMMFNSTEAIASCISTNYELI